MSEVTSTEDLARACKSGDKEAVLKALEEGADTTNYKPLFFASFNGHAAVVSLLLKSGAGPNQLNTKYYATPLIVASQNGHADVVKLLLEYGADADKAKTDTGATPIFMASQNGNTDVVQLLLEHGADADKALTTDAATPVYIASQNGHADVVQLLLDHGADANMARTTDGATPLFIASQNGHTDVVKLLLGHGADADTATTDDGQTPLFKASVREKTDVVRILLEAGANVDKANNNGDTPLYLASFREFTDIVRILLEAGADANKGNNHGATPLYWAIRKRSANVARLLLKAGADPNRPSHNGRPMLHLAVMDGMIGTVQLLLEHGARVNEKVPRADGEGPEAYTALFEFLFFVQGDDNSPAFGRRRLATVQLLIAAGADPVHTMSDGAHYDVDSFARNYVGGRTAEWLESTNGLDRTEIIKGLVASPTPAIPGDTFSLTQSLSASEEHAALDRTPAQQEESGRVLELCKELRREWSVPRHGLFHPAFRSTVLCLMLTIRTSKLKVPFAFRSILSAVPLEIWFLIVAQMSRDKWPFREALSITFRPSGARALPVQNGTGITTNFTSARTALNIWESRRAKDSVTVDFEVEYGRAMAGTLSYIDRLLERAPGDPNLAAARASAREIFRRIKERRAEGGSPIVVDCALALLKLERRPTERKMLANVCRNLFNKAADAVAKLHIQTGTLPGDYGADE